LLETAGPEIKAAAADRSAEIFDLAEALTMRKAEALPAEDLSLIIPTRAIWLVEPGANRTSVVRRELAIQAMKKIYGNGAALRILYQFGTGRPIPRKRNGQPNPEYNVAREIAGDFLPEDDSLTEFELNVASAKQAGYQETYKYTAMGFASAEERFSLIKAGSPRLELIKPKRVDGTLKDAFHCLNAHSEFLTRRQFVIATNGQYRPKDELQAQSWADDQQILMEPPIAIGDETGFSVEHDGKTITTGARPPMVYVNEAVILQRLGLIS